MREILFRAKRIDNEEWVEGSYLYCKKATTVSFRNEHYILVFDGYGVAYHEIDKDTICQYTGLTDKNGNNIWENDVVKGHYWERGNSHRHIGTIKYIGNAFKVVGVKQYEGYNDGLNGSYGRIGNIFDNPELKGSAE